MSAFEQSNPLHFVNLVAEAWEVQDHLGHLADATNNLCSLDGSCAIMSAVAEQCTAGQHQYD